MRRQPRRPLPTDIKLPQIDDLDFTALDTVERVIDFCLQKGFIKNKEVDIERLIISDTNLDLKKSPLPEHIDAQILRRDDGIYEITVNSKHSITRQRFSMAHEFAHYQLHREHLDNFKNGESILFRNDEKNIIEYQANRFASLILMPTDLIIQSYKDNKGDIKIMSKEFNVSSIALKFRLAQENLNNE